jgi:integrase
MPEGQQRKATLTRRVIEALEPAAKRYRVGDLKQRGLKLVVEPTGRKFWSVKYVMLDGRESEKVLGDWPGLMVEQARTDAGLVRARIQRQQVDPAEEIRRTRKEAEDQRRAEAKARELTFAKLAQAYIAASKHGFRAAKQRHHKSASTIYKEDKVLKKHAVPKLGTRPISEITRRDIVNLVEKVAHTCGEGAANGVIATIRRCFAYARHKEFVEHNPAIEISQYARPPRDVVASDDQIRFLWQALERAKQDVDFAALPGAKARHPRKDTKPAALALQLSLLTLQRRGEIVAIHKDHIDWRQALWTIPTLNKKERRIGLVPLAPMALSVLQEAFAHSRCDWAFAGRDTGTHMDAHTLTTFMDRLRETTGLKLITPHDLRRTGRTKLTSDEVGVDEMTAERVLNHVVGSRQQRAYDWQQYTSQKRAALVAWERELDRILANTPVAAAAPAPASLPEVEPLAGLPATATLH